MKMILFFPSLLLSSHASVVHLNEPIRIYHVTFTLYEANFFLLYEINLLDITN